VEEVARYSTVPVINGLTDLSHPCQAISDLMTIRERLGRLSGVRVTYLGDGNNVCGSLMLASAKFGMSFAAATPPAYQPDPETMKLAMRTAVQSGGTVELISDPHEAVRGANVLYTDVWTSMGQEDERKKRLAALSGFGIDANMLALARDDAIVMHCLPAHYGEEITEEVAYGERSAIWDQAENRLHAQKALLALVVR
jgi:ornithine carbamoyltransferase